MDAERRIKRFEVATELILRHPLTSSFSTLIEPNRGEFRGFKLLYSTDSLDSSFNGISLSTIENSCPSITKYFAASGLLFYDDELYNATLEHGAVAFLLDYSISFDTQVAEAFRVYEDGKNVTNWEWFEKLIRLVKIGNKGFNFDYTFYMVEDLIHTYDLNNRRPFNTVRALKRFDHLDTESFIKDSKNPMFYESRTDAGRRAADSISSFQKSKDVKRSLVRRKGVKLVLMKALQLLWEDRKSYLENLDELVCFSVENLGRFPKLELYFAWKLLKYGKKYRFFGPLMQRTNNAIEKLNGISWDLYSLRHQETMASNSRCGRFYIPFIASFDRRFKELMKACPIRCMLIDDQEKRINLIFFDEYEFFQDFNEAINKEMHLNLSSSAEKLKRLSKSVEDFDIDRKLVALENECRSFINEKKC